MSDFTNVDIDMDELEMAELIDMFFKRNIGPESYDVFQKEWLEHPDKTIDRLHAVTFRALFNHIVVEAITAGMRADGWIDEDGNETEQLKNIEQENEEK